MTARRKNIRLTDYDYSSPGAYFVTICVNNNLRLFGNIIDGNLELNDSGSMIEYWWRRLPSKFENVQIDAHITMPDHFHGLLFLVGADPCVRPDAPAGASMYQILRWFKTMTTNSYIRGVKFDNWQPFENTLWQRSYFDHVVRRIENLNQVREYILNNPARWSLRSEGINHI